MQYGRVALVGVGARMVRDVVTGFRPHVDGPGTDGNLGKVDGVAVETLSDDVLDRLSCEMGRELRLTVTRGGRDLEVLVRLDRVI